MVSEISIILKRLRWVRNDSEPFRFFASPGNFEARVLRGTQKSLRSCRLIAIFKYRYAHTGTPPTLSENHLFLSLPPPEIFIAQIGIYGSVKSSIQRRADLKTAKRIDVDDFWVEHLCTSQLCDIFQPNHICLGDLGFGSIKFEIRMKNDAS